MDKPISVGDLVAVVRPCPHCGDSRDVGKIFRVDYFSKLDTETDCCKDTTEELCAFPVYPGFGHTLPTLKRLPPMEELDDVKSHEEITA